jgi:hypothetical protein
LTNPQETDITTIIQRCHQHPSRTGRDRSEQVVAIRRYQWSRSSECASLGFGALASIEESVAGLVHGTEDELRSKLD